MRLQAVYDAKLARRGFADIESGADTNLISGSTFRRPNEVDYGPTVVLGLGHEQDLTAGDRESVFAAPRARAWALFSQAAHELPTDRRTRRILVAVAETGSITTAAGGRQSGRYSRRTVQRAVDSLCAAIGIDRRWLFETVSTGRYNVAPKPVPAPVRRLTPREIRGLSYEPPVRERRAS